MSPENPLLTHRPAALWFWSQRQCDSPPTAEGRYKRRSCAGWRRCHHWSRDCYCKPSSPHSEKQQGSHSQRERSLSLTHSAGQAADWVRASSRLPPMTCILHQVISLEKITTLLIFHNAFRTLEMGKGGNSLFLRSIAHLRNTCYQIGIKVSSLGVQMDVPVAVRKCNGNFHSFA